MRRAVRIGVVVALIAALATVAAVDARTRIKPQAGTYIGRVTKGNGTGKLTLIYARFLVGSRQKARRAVQLFNWTGVAVCSDGTKSDVSPIVTAPLRGNTFGGRAKSGDETVSLKGRFTGNNRMRGVVRATSNGGDCDTGPVAFRAKRRG